MGPEEANLTMILDQNGRLLWYLSMPGVTAMAILDCSVQQSMEGTAASSSYRHSAKGMERELATAERITLLQKTKTASMPSLRENSGFPESLSFFEMILILLVNL